MNLKTWILFLTLTFCQCHLVYSAEPELPQAGNMVLSSRYLQCIYPVWENGKIRLINYQGDYINEYSYDVPPILQPQLFSANRSSQFFLKRDGQFYRINSTGMEFPLAIPAPYEFKKYLGMDRYLVSKKDGDLELCRVYSSLKEEFLTEDFIWFRHSDDLVFGCFDIDRWREYANYHDHGIGYKPKKVPKTSVINLQNGNEIKCPNFCPMYGIGIGLIRAYNIDVNGEWKNKCILDYNGNIVLVLPEKHSTVHTYQDDRLITYNDKKNFVVDCSGNIIYETVDQISSFCCGLAKIEREVSAASSDKTTKSKYIGYINRSGEEVVPYHYIKGTDFHNGLAIVQDTEKKYHLINTYGDVIQENLFSNVPEKSTALMNNDRVDINSMLYQGVSMIHVFSRWVPRIENDEEIIYSEYTNILINFDGKGIWKKHGVIKNDLKDMKDYYSLFHYFADNIVSY